MSSFNTINNSNRWTIVETSSNNAHPDWLYETQPYRIKKEYWLQLFKATKKTVALVWMIKKKIDEKETKLKKIQK